MKDKGVIKKGTKEIKFIVDEAKILCYIKVKFG